MPKIDRPPAREGRVTGGTQLAESRPDPGLVRIVVVGVGDAGGGCVSDVAAIGLPGVRHVHVNARPDFVTPPADIVETVLIKERSVAGGSDSVDSRTRELCLDEAAPELAGILEGSQVVVVTAGMGGATETRVAPYVACLAKDAGAFVVGVVTTPFSFEGSRRIGEAVGGVARLRECCDSLIAIHSDRLIQGAGKGAEIVEAFERADAVVAQGIVAMCEMLNDGRETRVQFSDFREILGQPGGVLMAVGTGEGRLAAQDAIRHAIAHPLLNLSVKGANGVVVFVKGGPQLTRDTVRHVEELIARHVQKKFRVASGMSVEADLGDTVNVTLLAAGL